MNDAPDPRDIAAKQDKLARLNGQVTAIRAVLIELLQDVARAECQLESSQAMQLLEANERLVVSALGAQAEAESANGALDEASRARGLDPLTGLPNRSLLLDRLETAISSAKRHGNRVALLFLDLNQFKQINDRFGHAAGDRALQLVADCLKSSVRGTDTVSRHGGDEFLILLAEVAHAADAGVVADKVNAALGEYTRIDTHEVRLSASVGISLYPEDGVDAATLINRADAAMYVAKKHVLGGFAFHTNQPPGQASLPAPSRPSQPQRLTHLGSTAEEHQLRQEQLCEANEQLILAALGAQELLDAAEQTRRRHAELLALVAHELTNPFAPIRLAAATLGLPGAEKKLLPGIRAIIEHQVQKVARLVSELLDPRDSGEGPLPLDEQNFDVVTVIVQAVDACRPAIDSRQQTLDMMLPDALEVKGDPGFLAQVLMNLLTTASVYTDIGGRIQLRAELVGDSLLVTVIDGDRAVEAAGMGFDPFVLNPSASRAQDDGLGIRLAAAREIVEARGGTVVATSADVGRGTQFTASLPAAGTAVSGSAD